MKNKNKTLWMVFIAIILGVIIGPLVGEEKTFFYVRPFAVFDLFGKLFLNALSLIVAPLVMSAIIDGISKLGKEHSFKRVGAKTILTFVSINLIGIVIAIVISHIFSPFWKTQVASLSQSSFVGVKEAFGSSSSQIDQLLLQFIPTNIVDALAKNQIIGLIFFSLLFGFSITKIPIIASTTIRQFISGIFQTMIQMTHYIMKFLPLGVFCLIAKQFASSGWASVKPSLGLLSAAVIAFIILSIVILVLLKWIAKIPIYRFLKAIFPALITGFSTSSSSATLPVTIDCLEKRAGVSNKITSFIIPLGTSLNMAASGTYAFLAVFFLTHVYGIDLSILNQIVLFFITFIMTFGMPSVPSGGLFAIIIILNAMNLSLEAMGFLFILDRIVDMFRTATNVLCGSTSTIIVAKLEGEKNILE